MNLPAMAPTAAIAARPKRPYIIAGVVNNPAASPLPSVVPPP